MKGVGLNPASQIHYTDHLAVVCVMMGMPLLFLEEADYELAKKFYPKLNAQMAEFNEFNPENLIANYDVLFMSDLWNRDDFHKQYSLLEKKYNKRLRAVHCPHGFSDKGFYLQQCAFEDITLIYGQNMIDQLKHHGAYDRMYSCVTTGNYRYTYYKEHKKFYEQIIQEEIFNRLDRSKPTILYAPTWLDAEESTTFFDAPDYLFKQLPSAFNMIVKLHPRLELDDMAKYYHILGKYGEKANILFLKDFPAVFPLLDLADIFITDISSIGYDFLAFDKPMFFLNKHRRKQESDRGVYLFRCGVEVMPEDFPNIYQIISDNLENDHAKFSKIRSEVYNYTFAAERPFHDIKTDILRACSQDEKVQIL